MSNYKYIVYFAGPITGLSYGSATDWRDYAKSKLDASIVGMSPLRGKSYLSQIENIQNTHEDIALSCAKGITARDFNDCKRADMVIANFVESNIQDEFAKQHGYAGMADLLDEAFILNNTLPNTLNEEKLRNLPYGIVYINADIWGKLRQKAADILRVNTMAWARLRLPFKDDIAIDQVTLVNTWVENFIICIEEKVKMDKLMSISGHGFKTDDFDTSRELWIRHDSWCSYATRVLSNWSEFCKLYSLESYFSIAKKQALNNDKQGLVEFFNGLFELLLINMALWKVRENWCPKPSPQDYSISSFHDDMAAEVAKRFLNERDKDDY